MTIPPGTSITIKDSAQPGHIRTPYYIRGKTGVIERSLGEFKNPEQLAYSLPSSLYELYRVRFKMSELWNHDIENPNDTVEAEVFSQWIEEYNNAT
jgi:nitrile hydratase